MLNQKVGDTFFFPINQKFGLCQIIAIKPFKEIRPLIKNDTEFLNTLMYVIVVYNKIFDKRPTLEDVKGRQIYIVKSKPKNQPLYFWLDEEPSAKFKYIGNKKVDLDFELPISYKEHSKQEYPSVCPISARWSYVIDRILEDIKYLKKKQIKIKPKYFKNWIKYIEPEILLKTEKIMNGLLENLRDSDNDKNKITSLKKTIIALNKLDEKENFITTIEAEDLYEKLIQIASKNKLSKNITEEIIDNHRNW